MRRLRGISNSWVVNGMAKSGRVFVGGVGWGVDISLRAMGSEWRPGPGPGETKSGVEGAGFAAVSKGFWQAVSLQG